MARHATFTSLPDGDRPCGARQMSAWRARGRRGGLGGRSSFGLLVVLGANACASSESGRYALRSIDLQGTEQISSYAIKQCLISAEREHFEILLGISEPACGQPPFDGSPARITLWHWPWTEWPTFNRAVFQQDLERVLRFYRARGFHDAKIVRVSFHPDDAGGADPSGQCGKATDCRLDIQILVEEGEPTRVAQVSVEGTDALPAALQGELKRTPLIVAGGLPDELLHDRTKEKLRRALRSAGYADARVEGKVEVDSARHRATVSYHVEPGPLYEFGNVQVSGPGALSSEVIAKAAGIHPGQRFDPDLLHEAEVEVFALGAFSAVEVHEQLDAEQHRAEVLVRVTPLPRDSLRVGFGILSGTTELQGTEEVQSVPQFDLHLFGRYQQNQVLGTLGQLTLEERPRLIFPGEFPTFHDPSPGNVLSIGLNEPGWLEARTITSALASWDYGPDPYQGFFRSKISLRLAATRAFSSRRLSATLAVQQDIYSVGADPYDVAALGLLPSSYHYHFFEQELIWDLRDSKARPRAGAYLAFTSSEAPRWAGSDWAALRVAPEVRGYVPLPFDIVLAERLALASLVVLNASPALDPTSQALGPTDYRLRGGGASSNRGFAAGTLGAGPEGGARRWEGSLELRVPIGHDFVVAGFADVGDVNKAPRYRFANLNTSLGYGLRYYTIIGAIRLDVAYRIPKWQRIGGPPSDTPGAGTLPFSKVPGAVHLTIGDAF
jgi:outer membrane translocation and assembly module TamA